VTQEYYIENGVRRAVAARENGLKAILAVVHVPGQPSKTVLIDLDYLHSPKLAISRSERRYR